MPLSELADLAKTNLKDKQTQSDLIQATKRGFFSKTYMTLTLPIRKLFSRKPNPAAEALELAPKPLKRIAFMNKELIKENRKQLLPARILPFRFCTIQTVEQPLILSFHRRKHQHHERRSKQLCTIRLRSLFKKLRKKVKLVVSGRNAPLILQTKVLML